MANEFQKYPTDKAKYDKGYLRIFGIKCFACKGKGKFQTSVLLSFDLICPFCDGIGYYPKLKDRV